MSSPNIKPLAHDVIEKKGNTYIIRAEKTFTQNEFDRFARISGDNNPIHVDPAFSAATRFGRTVSHGMLLYTVIWGRIQTYFPQSLQRSQYLMFPAGTYTGELMEIELHVTPTSSAGEFEIKGEIRRAADGVVTCESISVIQYSGVLPC